MDPRLSDPPPTYSSAAVLQYSTDSPAGTLQLSDPNARRKSSTPTSPAASFFEQSMMSMSSGIKISHAPTLYAKETEYYFRDTNDVLLFSGQVEEQANGQKLIRFKNWERRTVFIIKLVISLEKMQIEIYTQDGYQKIGTLINDLKSKESPSLQTIAHGSCKTFYPVDQSLEDFLLKNAAGGLAGTVHIHRFCTPRRAQQQRSGAAEVKDVQVALNLVDPSLSPYDRAAFLGWGLFWVMLARMGDKIGQTSVLCAVFLVVLFFCAITIIIVLVKSGNK